MFNLNCVWTSETTVKTENQFRKFVRVGSVFAMLFVAMFAFNSCGDDSKAGEPDDNYEYPTDPGDGGGNGGGDNGGGTTVPSAPTSVSATAQSASSISVSWSAVSGATSYEVYYEVGSSSTKSLAGTVSGTSYTHTGLQASTAYYYYIKAKNSAGSSGYSSYASATTQSSGGGGGTTTKPSAPTGLSASNYGSTQIPSIRVSWNSVSSATSYKLYRSSSSSGTYSQVGSATSSTYAYDNSPLVGYNYYKVKAVNSAGESDFSSYTSYNYDNTVSPCPVTYGSCTVSGTTITIRWTVPTSSGCGAPTKATLRVKNPTSTSYADVQTLSGTATSVSFNYGPWADSNGYVYVGIITENAKGSSGGPPKVYDTVNKKWIN